MSLDYHLDKIENYKELCWMPDPDGEGVVMSQVTHNLIFNTISVGMGKITTDNYLEFYFRTNVIERLLDIKPEHRITVQDVIDHIGLATNVSFETRPKWIKRHMDYEWREVTYAAKKTKASNN